mgnify:CR=1 FL=1
MVCQPKRIPFFFTILKPTEKFSAVLNLKLNGKVVKRNFFILHRVLIFPSFSLKTSKVAIVVADIITSCVLIGSASNRLAISEFPLVHEEGWFGQPKYSTPTKKSFYVVSTSASVNYGQG